jgi:hypothetical protein
MDMKKKTLYGISAVIYIVLLGLVTLPPCTAMLDKVSPRIIGFPFMQFFLLFVPLFLAVWLIIWYLLECKIEDKEAAEEEKKGGSNE